MANSLFYSLGLIAVCLLHQINGHGYLLDPPSRSTAWRVGFDTPINHDDNGLNCGGSSTQHQKNDGKCGVCGDRYDSMEKPNEPGPGNIYATGTIVATYEAGQTIDITTMITAHHKGYFELRLCQNDIPQIGNDSSVAVTQECFDQHLLQVETGGTTHPSYVGETSYSVKLPAGVTCTACVLQWRYRTGNSYGCEPSNWFYRCGIGYGRQEEFKGCADIEIV